MPNDAQSPAMKIPLDTQHNRPTLLHTLSLISPLPCELQSCFHSLCTGIHGQDHVIPEEGSDFLGEFAKNGVVERP